MNTLPPTSNASNPDLPDAETVLNDFRRTSPRMAVDFEGIAENLPRHLLAEFPHILERLGPLWSLRECGLYLDGLMVSDRPGRAGFSSPAIADLFFLRQLHDFLYPPEDLSQLRVEDRIHRVSRARNLRELVERYGQGSENPASTPARPATDDSQVRPCGWGEVEGMEALRRLIQEPPNPRYQRLRFGDVLVDAGVITNVQRDAALDQQRRLTGDHRPIGKLLMDQAWIIEEDIVKVLCIQSRHLLVDLDAIPMSHEAAATIPQEIAQEYSVIPLLRFNRVLVLVVEEPLLPRSLKAVDMLQVMTGLSIRIAWAPPAAIARRLINYVPGRFEKRA